MADPHAYLEKLSAFSRMLRLEGLSVSPKETADAAQILSILGFEDREQVKTALRTVYAKSREEQLNFDRVFDGFFISEEAMRRQAQEQMQKEAEMEKARREAEEELNLNGQPMDLSEDQLDTYAAMPEEAREQLRRFMNRYRSNAERNPELYSNFIHSVFAKTLLEQQMRLGTREWAARRRTRSWAFCTGISPSLRTRRSPKPLPSSRPCPGRSTVS